MFTTSNFLMIRFTQNEKNSTDDDEEPSVVCYRPFIVQYYIFHFQKVG